MSMSEHDKELLKRFGMTEQRAERNAEKAESETADDGLMGRVYYGLHFDRSDEQMVNVSPRIPKSDLDRLSAEAKRYHISRSEYMRRQLSKV
jgi:hypothetical protein